MCKIDMYCEADELVKQMNLTTIGPHVQVAL